MESVFSVFEGKSVSYDSKVKLYDPVVTPVVLIVTSAEERPFLMVTNESKKALFCLRLIVEPHKSLIADFICSTENDVRLSNASKNGLFIATLRS